MLRCDTDVDRADYAEGREVDHVDGVRMVVRYVDARCDVGDTRIEPSGRDRGVDARRLCRDLLHRTRD